MSKSSRCSSLSRLLVSTALPVAVLATGAVPAYAQNVVSGTGAPGPNGGSGGVTGGTGGPADPFSVDNGFSVGNTYSWNQAFATGGAGGTGGDGTSFAGPGGAGGFARPTEIFR